MKLPGPTASEKLIAYFAANRGETLTAADAAVKFGLEFHTAAVALGRLRDRGFVVVSEAGRRGSRGNHSAFGVGPVLAQLIGHEIAEEPAS